MIALSGHNPGGNFDGSSLISGKANHVAIGDLRRIVGWEGDRADLSMHEFFFQPGTFRGKELQLKRPMVGNPQTCAKAGLQTSFGRQISQIRTKKCQRIDLAENGNALVNIHGAGNRFGLARINLFNPIGCFQNRSIRHVQDRQVREPVC